MLKAALQLNNFCTFVYNYIFATTVCQVFFIVKFHQHLPNSGINLLISFEFDIFQRVRAAFEKTPGAKVGRVRL